MLPDVLTTRFLVHDAAPDGVWSLDPSALEFLFEHVAPGARTLETGAGMSTVLFALKRAHHTCVTPAATEVARIRARCDAAGIPLDTIEFVVAPSERALPSLVRHDLDVVLIDGRHGFPAPMLDWYYTASMLRVGGLLLLDDTQLWTVRLVCDVLRREPEWRFDRALSKTAVFVKLAEHAEHKEWNAQRHVREQTEAMARLDRARRQRDTARALLRRGRLIVFTRALGRRLADAVAERRRRLRAGVRTS